MATSYTTLLGFALPTTGDLSGTWGDVVNASITQLVEDSVAGVATTSVASGDWTLTTTGSGADNQARKAILIPTGSSGTTRNINAPKSSKAYFVINSSTGSVVVRGGPTSPTTGVTITTGSQAIVAWNGSDFVNLTPAVTGFLPTTGGTMTGAITFASGQTVDGTNKIGYLNIPLSGIKTASYTLVAGDVGKFIELGTGGTIVVPASVFAAGDAISIFNNTSASISCTCSAVTYFYKGGTDADISSFSVTTRGVATILFITATVAVVTGNLA